MTGRTLARAALAAFALLFLAPAAQAQLIFRAYLAPTGNDANPCSLAAPCRLLPAALAAVADGGEIWMLDSANYNTAPVNITKSVTILAVPGALGSVVATGGNAINIATAGVSVTLRNLVIVPLPGGGGQSGIFMSAGALLVVEDCKISKLAGSGIFVGSPTSIANTSTVRVVDSTVADTAFSAMVFNDGVVATVLRTTVSGSNQHGIFAASENYDTKVSVLDSTISKNLLDGIRATNGAHVVVAGSRLANNGTAVRAFGNVASTTNAVVSDTVIAQAPGSTGVRAEATAASAIARVTVTRSTITGASSALEATNTGGGSALVTMSASTIAYNIFPWSIGAGGGVIKSLGNNHIEDNVAAGVGPLTSVVLK